VIEEKADFCSSCGAPRSFARPAQCPNCNIRLTGFGNFCPGCGQLLYKLCGTCGSRLMSGWLHCPVCNRPSESQEMLQAQEGPLPPTALPAVDGASPTALAEILNQEGATAFEREQYEDAEQLFRRAVELDPEEALYFTNLAAALGELGREPEADQAIRRALEIDPDDPATLLAAGVFASDRDRHEDAAYYWNRILEVAPDSEEAEEARSNLEEMGAS
jgi:tetratricopeptide (TPR) repeat protein